MPRKKQNPEKAERKEAVANPPAADARHGAENAPQGAPGGGEPLPTTGGGEAQQGGKKGFYGRLGELRARAQRLAMVGLDDKTIATLLREPEERVRNFLGEAIDFGRAQLKAQIMGAQVKAAVEDRDPAILKRLGEEYCGQGVITQQGAIANQGKQVFVLNVGVPPKNLDGPPPGPVRSLPAPKKAEVIDAEFEDVAEG